MNESIRQDPMFKQLVAMAKNSTMTRRTALAGAGVGAMAVALSACAPGGTTNTALTAAKDLSDSEKTLIWHNWSLYMDEDEDGK